MSDKPQTHPESDERYTLIRTLERHDWYIHTWFAKRSDNTQVIIKQFSTVAVDDPPISSTNIYTKVTKTIEELNLLDKRVLPLVPYDDVYWRNDLKPAKVFICRPYFEKRLIDTLTENSYESREDRLNLITQLEQIATAISQTSQQSFDWQALFPNNFMLDGDGNWQLVDYGIHPLYDLIKNSYQGSKPVSQSWNFQHLWLPRSHPDLPNPTIDIQLMFALLYFYFTQGHSIFENPYNTFKSKASFLDENDYYRKQYWQTGQVDLKLMRLDEGRLAVQRAISAFPDQRFTSESEFLIALREAIM